MRMESALVCLPLFFFSRLLLPGSSSSASPPFYIFGWVNTVTDRFLTEIALRCASYTDNNRQKMVEEKLVCVYSQRRFPPDGPPHLRKKICFLFLFFFYSSFSKGRKIDTKDVLSSTCSTAWLRIACFVDPFYAMNSLGRKRERKSGTSSYHGQFGFRYGSLSFFFFFSSLGRRR